MEEEGIIKDALELKATTAGAGLSEENKEAELSLAILTQNSKT